jgi:hypothetical protein
MKKQFHLSIPKPCNEDWSKMTQKEQGRFCSSCSKTVTDFTQKTRKEIQEYLEQKSSGSVCGRFRREQLDAITIEIPNRTFDHPLPFQKMFILTLIFVMGTNLFSCQSSDGKKQKIEDVIVIDNHKNNLESIDAISQQQCEAILEEMINPSRIPHPDSIPKKYYYVGETRDFYQKLPPLYNPNFHLDSIVEIEEEEEVIEDVPYYSRKEIRELDSIANLPPSKRPSPPEVTGIVLEMNQVMGDIDESHDNEEPSDTIPEVEEVCEDVVFGIVIEEPPRFPESKHLTRQEAKEDFNQRFTNLFKENFEALQRSLGLNSGTYRVVILFHIDEQGRIIDIQVNAPHKAFEKEAKRVVKMVPKLIPATQRGKPVGSKFTLPLRIEVE